jgi:UDP-N-acetylglucosamine/UDP-N-acetyl-alpha-D-glucosaminouronate 4-epimerase
MHILVTGGAGFIGSHLVAALVREGHRVRVLDDLSTGRRENLAGLLDDVELLIGDAADPQAASRAAAGVETVFHEAALPSVARSVADPARSHQAGATATLTLLEAARQARTRRFIYAGSSSAYGNSRRLPKHEAMVPRPRSPYAAAKLAGEHYVHVYAQLHGLEAVTLRYFNVFGPRQRGDSPYSGVISRFIADLVAGRAPVVHGDGLQSRDFTYVDNVVHANLLALRAPGLVGQAVNVATGRRITLRTLLSVLGDVLERPVAPQRAAERPGDVRHSLADLRLAGKLLGYRPTVGFEEGLRRTVEWHRESRPENSPECAA